MRRFHLTNNAPKNCAIISYMPHNVCNFTCDYCCEQNNDGSMRWNDDYKSPAKFINEVRERNGHAFVEIIGGEPTLWPNLQNFIEEITHENLLIDLATNGSRTLRYWEEFKESNIVITFSWHSKEVDTNHLYEVVKIMKNKAYSHVSILLTPDNFEEAKKACDLFKTLDVFVNVIPTRMKINSSQLYNFTQEQISFIKDNTNDWSRIKIPDWKKRLHPITVIINDQPKLWRTEIIEKNNVYTNWTCNAGVDRFVIEPDGNIMKCWHNIGGSIGNIYTGYILPSDPIICTLKKPCGCKLDAMAEKWSPDV